MAQGSQKFKATLNGASEVPPVQTKASGDATFELNQMARLWTMQSM